MPMNIAQKNEKILRNFQSEENIVVTHITVRQSIFFLILRLIVLETLAAAGLVVFFSAILSRQALDLISTNYYGYVIPFFILIVIIKSCIMIYIIIVA